MISTVSDLSENLRKASGTITLTPSDLSTKSYTYLDPTISATSDVLVAYHQDYRKVCADAEVYVSSQTDNQIVIECTNVPTTDIKLNILILNSSKQVEEITAGQLYYPSTGKADNDFIGFSFGGIHCFSFGLKRTSDGSRFNENLLPVMQDKTVQVPGGDGTYYFGSYYTQRQLNISIAFDSVSDSDFQRIRAWLGDKKIKNLIFDEAPYKVYRAKATGTAVIKHICFEENGERIYKGEGSLQFTCYSPYAHSPKDMKFLSDYDEDIYTTKSQWALTSGMLEINSGVDMFDVSTKVAVLHNPGDLETDFNLTLNFVSGYLNLNDISLNGADGSLYFKKIRQKSYIDPITGISKVDAAIRINSKSNLIEGLTDKGKLSGNLYNEYITKGSFFKIPICDKMDNIKMGINTTDDIPSMKPILEYNYLYF